MDGWSEGGRKGGRVGREGCGRVKMEGREGAMDGWVVGLDGEIPYYSKTNVPFCVHFWKKSSILSIGTIACAFVVSAAVGETIIPLLVGELFDRMGTLVFMICAVVLCSLAIISFGILSIIAAGKRNPATRYVYQNVHCISPHNYCHFINENVKCSLPQLPAHH